MKYYHRNAESGELEEVSKEFLEARDKFMQQFVNTSGKIIGKIQIASTLAEDGNDDFYFKKLWKTPEP